MSFTSKYAQSTSRLPRQSQGSSCHMLTETGWQHSSQSGRFPPWSLSALSLIALQICFICAISWNQVSLKRKTGKIAMAAWSLPLCLLDQNISCLIQSTYESYYCMYNRKSQLIASRSCHNYIIISDTVWEKVQYKRIEEIWKQNHMFLVWTPHYVLLLPCFTATVTTVECFSLFYF